jgi:nucleotide-binding universal stress UspA family protein
MFQHVAVALDDSPQSARALRAGIELAARLGLGLSTITVKESLPAYTAFAAAADSSAIRQLQDEHDRHYEVLMQRAAEEGSARGVIVTPFLLEGDMLGTVVSVVEQQGIDLLVIGLHRRSMRMSSLWSTVYSLAQDLSCDMLGIH